MENYRVSLLGRRKFHLFLSLLTLLTFGLGSLRAAKITDVADIESGKTYYIGATTGTTDYYLSVNGSSASSTAIAGTAVSERTSAATFVFTQSGDNWTIKFADSDNYLSLSSSKNNGKVIVNTSANWTITNNSEKSLLSLACGDTYALQKNNSGTQFGSYAKTQTDVWLEEVSNTPAIAFKKNNNTITELDFGEVEQNQGSVSKTFTLTGANLENQVTLYTNGALWSVGETVYSPDGDGNINATVTVYLNTDVATGNKDSYLYAEWADDPKPEGSKNDTLLLLATLVEPHEITPGTYDIVTNNTFWGCEEINKSNATESEINFIGKANDIQVEIDNHSKGNAYINGTHTRVYDSYTMQFSVPEGYVITDIVFTPESNTWAGTHTANAGAMTDNKTWEGSVNSVTITFKGTCRIAGIAVTYETAPTILAPNILGATPFYPSTLITMNCATDGATIYYTTNGDDPTSSDAAYTAPIEITGTTTFKAISVKGSDISDITERTFTKATLLTVADALDMIDALNQGASTADTMYVEGYVKEITEIDITNNHNATYLIKDADADNELMVFRGKAMNGADFTSNDQLTVGDKVIVKGKLQKYKDSNNNITPEIKNINYIVERTEKGDVTSLTIGGTLTKASGYDAGDIISTDGLTATATYENGYTGDVTAEATWTVDGYAEKIIYIAESDYAFSASYGGKSDGTVIRVYANTYAVSFDTPEHGALVVKYAGTAISSGDEFVKGTELTVETTPAVGYKPATLTAGDVDILSYKQFTVGAADIEVVATFAPIPVQVAGTMSSWTPIDFTANGDGTATFSANIDASSYEFKMVIDGEWRGVDGANNTSYWFTRENPSASNITGNSANNMTLVTDRKGDYTFTWNFADNSLTVTYPTANPTFAVTFEQPTSGALTILSNSVAITSGDEFEEGEELTVEATPANGYKLDGIQVLKASDNSDVTADVLSNGTLTVPTYAIKVVATFSEDIKPYFPMAWSKTSYTLTYGTSVDPSLYARLIIDESLKDNPVALTSSNTDVVAITSTNYEDGGFTINLNIKKPGMVDLTATYAADGTYQETVEIFKLTVNKADADLAWSANEATAYTIGKSYELPALTNPNGLLSIDYSSSETTIATIDDLGAITPVAEGTTTITAAFGGNDYYNETSVSYTLNVYAPASVSVTGVSEMFYELNDAFSYDGLVATVTYGDDSQLDVTADAEWSGGPATVTESAYKTITATFGGQSGSKQILLGIRNHHVTATAEHGTVSFEYEGEPTTKTWWEKGKTLTVEVTPDLGYKLTALTAGGADILDSKQFTVGTVDIEVVATFALIPVQVAGTMSGWNPIDFTLNGDGTASFSANIEANSYEFKMIIDGEQRGIDGENNTSYILSRENPSATGIVSDCNNNMTLVTDHKGDYTFTWDFADNSLTVTYPVIPTFAVTFEQPAFGTLAISSNSVAITSGDEFEEGEELTVEATPANGYKLDGIQVLKAEDDSDVTAEVLNNGTLIMPAYAIKVSAIFSLNDPTAISNAATETKAVKMIENGQLIIIKNGIRYSTLGEQIR